MSTYTYRTDAEHDAREFNSADTAIAAAIADGDWDDLDSQQELRYIADGAWLCVYEDGVPCIVRGEMW